MGTNTFARGDRWIQAQGVWGLREKGLLQGVVKRRVEHWVRWVIEPDLQIGWGDKQIWLMAKQIIMNLTDHFTPRLPNVTLEKSVTFQTNPAMWYICFLLMLSNHIQTRVDEERTLVTPRKSLNAIQIGCWNWEKLFWAERPGQQAFDHSNTGSNP